jgi:ATP-dependent Clp protease ATP-binding subunit ClpC
MFECFSERARQVVVLAQVESQALDHDYIGTEHLVLGVLGEKEGVAARALASLEITVDDVRARVVQIVGRGNTLPPTTIPFTPRAKRVLELAAREAPTLRKDSIGTEHILLGLVREHDGVAALVLRQLGGDAETIRRTIEGMSSGPA